jgi:hypothetical protein
MSPAAPTRRVNRGKGHSYVLDGEPVDGVTAILGDGIPKPQLINWAANTTAGYAVDHWDELAAETPSARLRRLERARWESSGTAAVRGTDVHKFAQRLAAGETVDVPEPLAGHVDAYLQFVADWQPDELVVEAPVFHRAYRYAGTLDLIAELVDGLTWLLDWKTGGKGIYVETAVQLAAYRHAEFYLGADGVTEHPLPEIDFCGAVWLRADGYDLYPVDAGERTFRTFRYAQQVARFSNAPRDRYVHDSLAPPALEAA